LRARRSAASVTVNSLLSYSMAIKRPPLTHTGKHGKLLVDMKAGLHIDRAVELHRCSRVSVAGDELHWQLAQASFDPIAEYGKEPHRRFIAADTDDALLSFVRGWGPLRPSWTNSARISEYRFERNQFAALAKLLAAIEQAELRREALEDILRLPEPRPTDAHFFSNMPQFCGQYSNAPEAFIRALSDTRVDELCLQTVNEFSFNWNPIFVATNDKSGSRLRATVWVMSLWEALLWMVWQDVWLKTPYRFCQECRSLIISATKHDKKFCTPECARRKTDREWKQKMRGRKTGGTTKPRNVKGKKRRQHGNI
jgi:hypothetical protein